MTAGVELLVAVGLMTLVAVLGARYGADSRPGVDEAAPGWLGRPPG